MSPDVADDDVERRDARADALATRDGAEHGARAVSESMESQTRLDVDVDDAERTQNATDVEEAKKVGDEEARRALERAPDRERRLEAVVRDEEINAEDVLSDEAPPGLEDDEETADGDLEARAVAAAISGVRIDGRVTRTFGVLIPNTTTTAASNESQISIARRRAKASASLAWRTRLESLAPDESSDQVERTIDIRARTYEETTSKYINMSYFEKRVAPLMTHPDGRRNDTTARVARWIFGEQYIKRDGFVDEESDEEIETTGENKIEDDVEKQSDTPAESNSACGWCFGTTTPTKVVEKPVIEHADEVESESERRKPKPKKFDITVATQDLLHKQNECARLEASCLQIFADMKRTARDLQGTFSRTMMKTDPRAIELQSTIKMMEIDLKRMLFNRDALQVEISKLQKQIADDESMKAPEVVVVEKDEISELYVNDPFETFGGRNGAAPVVLFLALAPLYLWTHYEWTQTNRVTKLSLKQRSSEENPISSVYFYNPLMVPGACRLRLSASNVELFALLLAVQSLVSFKIWVASQSVYEHEDFLTTYQYMVITSFFSVARPCNNATIYSLRRSKRRARERFTQTLWKEDEYERVPIHSTKRLFAPNEFIGTSEAAFDVASVEDYDEFGNRRKIELDEDEAKDSLKIRIMTELREEGGRFDDAWRREEEFDEPSTSDSGGSGDADRRTNAFSEYIKSSLTGSEAVLEEGDPRYEELRKEYVLKARAERKAEQGQSGARSIFDVSGSLNSLLSRGEAQTDTARPSITQNLEEQQQSRLNIDEADSVLRAVSFMSAKHKKKAGGGKKYWPNGTAPADESKVARAVADDDDAEG